MKKATLIIAAAAIVGIGSAFTTRQVSDAKSGTYGIVDQDDDYYYVSLTAGTCSGTTGDCKITTSDTPDGQNRVPKDGNTTVTEHGSFSN